MVKLDHKLAKSEVSAEDQKMSFNIFIIILSNDYAFIKQMFIPELKIRIKIIQKRTRSIEKNDHDYGLSGISKTSILKNWLFGEGSI